MGGSMADSGIPFISDIEGEYELNKQQAKQHELDARYNAGQRRRVAERLMGEQIAAFGASGVELEGTPMDQIQADMEDAEIEALNITYAGEMQAAFMKRKAHMARTRAYTELAMKAAAGAGGGGAGAAAAGGGGGGGGGSGMSSFSSGTGGYSMSENSSSYGIKNKGLA